ncbi:MAG: hypothetical protein ISP40_08725 [Alphaproteobacteria bacterium]|nr:hypothetical protein [Alphaproteobacteria bacterium]
MKYKIEPTEAQMVGNELENYCRKLVSEIDNVKQGLQRDWLLADNSAIQNCYEAIDQAINKLREHSARLKDVTDASNINLETHFFDFSNKEINGNLSNIINIMSKSADHPKDIVAEDLEDEELIFEVLEDYGYWVHDYIVE